jgi:hypothetical protein
MGSSRIRRHLRGRTGLIILLALVLIMLLVMVPPGVSYLAVLVLGGYAVGRLHERLRGSQPRRRRRPRRRRATS